MHLYKQQLSTSERDINNRNSCYFLSSLPRHNLSKKTFVSPIVSTPVTSQQEKNKDKSRYLTHENLWLFMRI